MGNKSSQQTLRLFNVAGKNGLTLKEAEDKGIREDVIVMLTFLGQLSVKGGHAYITPEGQQAIRR